MYAEDTFFHLSMWGRTGLVLLSAVLFILCLGLVWLAARLPVFLRVLIAVLLFWGFTFFVSIAILVYV